MSVFKHLMKDRSLRYFGSVILMILVTLTSVALSQSSYNLDYGASCSFDYECDNFNFLFCNNQKHKCDCRMGSEWHFDLQKCLRLDGQNCSTTSSWEQCTSNASCITGQCRCDDDYLSNGVGKCVLSYGMPCDDITQFCSSRHYLECPKLSSNPQPRKCKCIKEGVNYIWDDMKSKCVALIGTSCERTNSQEEYLSDCIDNAFCNVQDDCECKPGYSITREKTCALKFGESCDNSRRRFCNKYDFLNCLDGKCNCEFFNQMKYDENAGKCRLLSGEPCGWPINGSRGTGNLTSIAVKTSDFSFNGMDDRIHDCVQGAVCIARNEHGKGVCACVDGKRQAPDKTCEDILFSANDELGIVEPYVENEFGGTLCTDLPIRGNVLNRNCIGVSPSKKLICRWESGILVCTCGEGAFFNGSCINYPQQNCTGSERSPLCAVNSFCDVQSGVCKCIEHFKLETETSSCKPGYDPNMISNEIQQNKIRDEEDENDKDLVQSGKITNGSCASLHNWLDRMKCLCEMIGPLAVWSEEGRLCVGLASAPCVVDPSINFICTYKAFCDLESYNHICQCEEGYYQTSANVCEVDDGLGTDYHDDNYDNNVNPHITLTRTMLSNTDKLISEIIIMLACLILALPKLFVELIV